jgi:transcriptional regulator with XRE-family HTH domain
MEKVTFHKAIKKSGTNKICQPNNYFGQSLREARLKKKLTQEIAADLLHITQAQWSAYEVGKSRPTLDMIIDISKVLKINPFDLINSSLSKSKYFKAPIQDQNTNNNIKVNGPKKVSKKIKELC